MLPLRHRTALLAVGVSLLVLVLPSTAMAASTLGFSPTRLDVRAEAGETLTRDVFVTAQGDEPLTVDFSHADFGFTNEAYGLTLIEDDAPETTAFSTRGWFSVPKERYRVPAGETLTVPVTIEVPDNTPGGTYLGAAFFATAVESGQLRQSARTGALVFISVAGGEPPKPKVESFDTPRLVTGGPIKPDIVIGNDGDEWFAYEGTIQLDGDDEGAVKVARQVVVPGQPRKVRIDPNVPGAKGAPSVGGRDLSFGRHELVSRLRIEPTGDTLVTRRTVWVVPVWARIVGAVLWLAAIAGIGLLTRWLLRRRRATPAVEEVVVDEHEQYDDIDDEEFEDVEDIEEFDDIDLDSDEPQLA
ncbi:MAG: hypothetical protein JWO69_1345 [Thermoleophilia bacterium]|nr:hypothetical protein [Thermoleophilia bacterium]